MDTASSGRPADAHDPSISPGAAASGPMTAMRRISGESGKTCGAMGQEHDGSPRRPPAPVRGVPPFCAAWAAVDPRR